MTPLLLVRDPIAADEQPWRRLWEGYLAFYEATLAPEITTYTWRRMLDTVAPVVGRVVEHDGKVRGFTVSVIHEGTWTTQPICYLEDLYVDPETRGIGAGRALIDDLIQLANARGWSRLTWHTRAQNVTARRLYDRYGPADDFVRYRIALS